MGGPDAGALRCPLGGKGTSDGPGKGGVVNHTTPLRNAACGMRQTGSALAD